MNSGASEPVGRERRCSDAQLLETAAEAVIAAFDPALRQKLPPASAAALRLLETALMLYQDSQDGNGSSS